MLPILLAVALAAPGSSIGTSRMILRDPQEGPTPVTKFMIPSRIPDCTTTEQIQRAREEQMKGWDADCLIPRKSDLQQQQQQH